MKYIPDKQYEKICRTAEGRSDSAPVSLREAKKALDSRDPKRGLVGPVVSQLLTLLSASTEDEAYSEVLKASRALRSAMYGNKVAIMVPLEVTSYCASDCDFCGWKESNREMPRMTISKDTLIAEAEILLKLGFSHFEISGGDHLAFLRNHLLEYVGVLKKTVVAHDPHGEVSICLTPLTEKHYQGLKKAGLDTVLTWQETYDPAVYARHVRSGPKLTGLSEDYTQKQSNEGYWDRMVSQELAVRCGLQVGLGAMLGLSPSPASDIAAAILHAQTLIENYGSQVQPIIIRMPAWNPLTTPKADERPRAPFAFEKHFEFISAVYLLALPDHLAWVFPNCRVTKTTQMASVQTAGCFTSSMVSLFPGGYLGEGELKPEAFVSSSVAKPTKETLRKAEQFVHHFGVHSEYLKLLSNQGLTVCSVKDLRSQKTQ